MGAGSARQHQTVQLTMPAHTYRSSFDWRSFKRPSALLSAVIILSSVAPGWAQESPGVQHRAAAPGQAGCRLQGNAEVQHNLAVFQSPHAKEPIAVLTGVPIELTLSELPRIPDGGRAAMATTAKAGVDLAGYVAASAVQLFTRKVVAVEPGLWIAPGAAVSYVQARPNALRVRLTTPSLTREALEAWADCSALGLDDAGVPALAVPKQATPYLSSTSRVGLFKDSDDSAHPWLTLTAPAWSDGLVFWVTHVKRGLARVQYRDRFVIEGWTRTRWLERLPEGQAIEPAATPRAAKNLPNLKLVGNPRLFEVKHAIPIRLRPTLDARPIGTLRSGTEVYVTDDATVGWVGVLPETLAVTAPGGGQFWIPAPAVAER